MSEMSKFEKVIKALDLCKYDPDPGQEIKWYHSCEKCPYNDLGIQCCSELFSDAIELLKEQERLVKYYRDRWLERIGPIDFDGL